jgi:hypothetical protein
MYTCTVCKKDFDYPDFDCTKQIGKHTVEAKTYVHGGSSNIQNIRDRRRFSPTVFLRADTQAITPTGQIVHTDPLVVEFTDAKYTTGNPEEQYWLETVASKKFPIYWGEEGEKVWRENQLSPTQQAEIQRAELADLTRKIKESNDLLSQTRNRQKVTA